MQINQSIAQLSDQAVIDILSYLTEELKEDVPETNRAAIKNSEEANAAVAELLKENNVAIDLPDDQELAKPQHARAVLQMLWNDEEIRGKVEALIAHPPARSQRSAVETAITAAIVIGGLITWLQTKIDIQVSRKDGKTSFKFRLLKEKSSEKLIKDVVKPVSRIFTGAAEKDK